MRRVLSLCPLNEIKGRRDVWETTVLWSVKVRNYQEAHWWRWQSIHW